MPDVMPRSFSYDSLISLVLGDEAFRLRPFPIMDSPGSGTFSWSSSSRASGASAIPVCVGCRFAVMAVLLRVADGTRGHGRSVSFCTLQRLQDTDRSSRLRHGAITSFDLWRVRSLDRNSTERKRPRHTHPLRQTRWQTGQAVSEGDISSGTGICNRTREPQGFPECKIGTDLRTTTRERCAAIRKRPRCMIPRYS